MTFMRIASFNLENLGDAGTDSAPEEIRLKVLRPQLERLDADIVCLQEVNGDKVRGQANREFLLLERLLEGTPYAGFNRVHSIDPLAGKPSDHHNLMVLSRWPVGSARQVWHDYVPAPIHTPSLARAAERLPAPVTWDRPLQHCVIGVDDKRLHVINLHLRAPRAAFVAGGKIGRVAWTTVADWAEGFYVAMLKRDGQALEARLVIEEIFDAEPDALVMVCGDFNAEMREGPLRILMAQSDDTHNGELAGRSLVSLERAVAPAQRYSLIHHGERVMIDHMLVSRPLLARFRHFEIHNEQLGDDLFAHAAVRRDPDSYHAPVVAQFDL
ncbi:MAG: endonuclease/exonuclease/phosphatase family protein [Rhodobiaceae bacterium]|nr:endonuclease/exonuclease/phosphatase family protein [Rhodobiaceae bacterium]MCC0040769.1 endonuclease/exonuclease/phosphatase family protein [Rhodobiaceae bacterium]